MSDLQQRAREWLERCGRPEIPADLVLAAKPIIEEVARSGWASVEDGPPEIGDSFDASKTVLVYPGYKRACLMRVGDSTEWLDSLLS